MDLHSQPQPTFEVRCQHCNVSFPVGTKRCIHCGEKIGRPLFAPITSEDGTPIFRPADGLADAEADDGDAEVAPRGGRFLRTGFTVFWLLLAVLSAAVRACQER